MIDVKCKQCGVGFKTYPYRIKGDKKLFCSRKCYGEYSSVHLKGSNNNSWKGYDIGYYGIHDWLRKNYGKANKCENPECKCKNIKRYEWALIKGKNCERKRENFWKLCSSCHKKYDMTDEKRKQMSEVSKGKHHSPKTEFKKGIVPWISGKKHSEETRKKMSEAHKGCITWNKGLKYQLTVK